MESEPDRSAHVIAYCFVFMVGLAFGSIFTLILT